MGLGQVEGGLSAPTAPLRRRGLSLSVLGRSLCGAAACRGYLRAAAPAGQAGRARRSGLASERHCRRTLRPLSPPACNRVEAGSLFLGQAALPREAR